MPALTFVWKCENIKFVKNRKSGYIEKMKKIRKKHKRKQQSTTTQMIVLGFLIAIMVGTFLLILPISSADNVWTNPLDALFTSTSAVSVTGLMLHSTFSYWSDFGHIVLLCLIQCGGLGIVAFTTILAVILGRKVTLKDRLLIEDAFNLTTLSGLVRFLKKIFILTLIMEGIGALLYMFVFVPEFGARGVWISIFMSVSAFCNAGIDIIGDTSLIPYASNVFINVVTMALVISGGIGFIVWFDFFDVIEKIYKKDIRLNQFWQKLKVHTKIVIIMTVVLIVAGAVLVLLLEYDNPGTLGAMPLPEKIMAAVFQSVTTRTAGFTTISQNELRDSTVFVSIILMFIGGSSVSAAGGVKTGTVAVLLIAAICVVRGDDETIVFGRTIPHSNVKKALAVFSISITLTFVAVIAMTMITGLDFINCAYETVSALTTVGFTRNTTELLNIPARFMIILCMYLGRIGPISMAIAFTRKGKQASKLTYPSEEITVG